MLCISFRVYKGLGFKDFKAISSIYTFGIVRVLFGSSFSRHGSNPYLASDTSCEQSKICALKHGFKVEGLRDLGLQVFKITERFTGLRLRD